MTKKKYLEKWFAERRITTKLIIFFFTHLLFPLHLGFLILLILLRILFISWGINGPKLRLLFPRAFLRTVNFFLMSCGFSFIKGAIWKLSYWRYFKHYKSYVIFLYTIIRSLIVGVTSSFRIKWCIVRTIVLPVKYWFKKNVGFRLSSAVLLFLEKIIGMPLAISILSISPDSSGFGRLAPSEKSRENRNAAKSTINHQCPNEYPTLWIENNVWVIYYSKCSNHRPTADIKAKPIFF